MYFMDESRNDFRVSTIYGILPILLLLSISSNSNALVVPMMWMIPPHVISNQIDGGGGVSSPNDISTESYQRSKHLVRQREMVPSRLEQLSLHTMLLSSEAISDMALADAVGLTNTMDTTTNDVVSSRDASAAENYQIIAEEKAVPSWTAITERLSGMKLERDEVVRVIDQNTVKLERNGLVSFAAVQTPSSSSKYRFPDCMEKSPSSKLRQLLPKKEKVRLRFVDDNNSDSSRPRMALVLKDNGTFVNGELVRAGFARPTARGREASERLLPGLTDGLNILQHEAKEREVGIYQTCQNVEASIATDDQFEALDVKVTTNWGFGNQILQEKDIPKVPPSNPGDKRGCSDFETYEAALKYYETYAPYYGDVAKLDRDHDGIPCPGLPHTLDQTKYRMKVPLSITKTNP